MISTDGLIWKVSANYPETFEVMDRKARVLHRCSLDKPIIPLDEGNPRMEVSTLRPHVYEFRCRDCGQRMRVSYEIYEQVKEHLEVQR
jgi:hypothetical protein